MSANGILNDFDLTNDNCDCMILNFWSCVNYGASLTAWGTQLLAEKVGLTAKVINYRPRIPLTYEGSFSEEFALRHLNLTRPIANYEDFLSLNENCKTFITGSDQVWNAGIMRSHSSQVTENIYVLDFVNENSRKLSYAASFGLDYFKGNNYQKEMFRYYVSQYDAISVREGEGKKILEEMGIPNAVQLIDGAFHIPQSTLDELIKEDSKVSELKLDQPYIGVYVLPYFAQSKWYLQLLEQASSQLKLPLRFFEFNPKKSVSEWLAFIKNASFMITDSYHATVFSLIFNVPVVQVKNAKTQSRFISLFGLLGLPDVSIGQEFVGDFDFFKIVRLYDWERINNKIESECLRAEKWLKEAVSEPIKEKEALFHNITHSYNLMRSKQADRARYLLRNKNSIIIKYIISSCLSLITFGAFNKRMYEAKVRYGRQFQQLKRIL